MIDARVGYVEQIVHASVAEAVSLQRDGCDCLSQGLVLRVHHRLVAIGISAQPHKAAGAAFAQGVVVHHAQRSVPAHLWG